MWINNQLLCFRNHLNNYKQYFEDINKTIVDEKSKQQQLFLISVKEIEKLKTQQRYLEDQILLLRNEFKDDLSDLKILIIEDIEKSK